MNQADESNRDPYRGVVIVLLAIAALGSAGGIVGGIQLADPVLLAVALTLGISAGVLAGIATGQAMRLQPAQGAELHLSLTLEEPGAAEATEGEAPAGATAEVPAATELRSRLTTVSRQMAFWYRGRGRLEKIRLGTAAAGALAIFLLLLHDNSGFPPYPLSAGIAAALCLIAAGIAATAVHYLGEIDPAEFPESPALRRGARAVAWTLVLAAVSVGVAWLDMRTVLSILFFAVLAVNAAICYGLFAVKSAQEESSAVFPLDIGVLSVLGSRTNIFGSILDSAERQLGIDLRSTWALVVLRRSLEPLLLSLLLIGWLSTAVTVVGIEEQGLIERLGVPVGGDPLLAGLHVHWPWPVDKVFRIPVRRVQVLEVGHEGEEAPGPENVLWAVEHAPNEFTLLLGNGRDLITVDAGVQFRIVDARAFRYHCQNPAQALSAIAYRAVMRNTVNLTLSDALSQNVAGLTVRMRDMIQRDADALGLGVAVLGFTVGGMHPPVAVAKDYQGVVSAELRKVTAVVSAQVYRVRVLPLSESAALVGSNTARAEGAEALATAAGEAWSFRTLEAQYRAAPNEYFFRRRLETLEKSLANRGFTLVDARFERDGGELWVTQ
jgi:regulator of protease activity HflC (stomatin/prohibitin superfamily)